MMNAKKNWYLTQFELFEKNLNGKRHTETQKIREESRKRFDALEFPTMQNEDWKYTNLQPLLQHNYEPVPVPDKIDFPVQTIAPFLIDDQAIRLVFINGHFYPEWSHLQNVPKKAVIKNIAEAARSHPDLIRNHLTHHAPQHDNIFTALNHSFLVDGAFIHLPDSLEVETPIHILYITYAPGRMALTHPTTLVMAGKNSKASIVQHHLPVQTDIYLTNAVSEFILSQDAHITHHKIQLESPMAYHIENRQILQGRSSHFVSNDFTFGSVWTRNNTFALLNDSHAECTLNGLYIAKAQQHIDNFTVIDHAKPDCISRELYKGILGDRATGIFNGKIIVRPDAQRTDAKQSNHNILLTPEASVNTKPQLEIFADDVKCTHGATIGRLQEDALFYLRSRGIDQHQARMILMKAFAGQLIESIRHEGLKQQLEKLLFAHFKTA